MAQAAWEAFRGKAVVVDDSTYDAMRNAFPDLGLEVSVPADGETYTFASAGDDSYDEGILTYLASLREHNGPMPTCKAVRFLYVDRGICCWKDFSAAVLATFPCVQLLILAQNYGRCSSFYDVWGTATIHDMYIHDCQSHFDAGRVAAASTAAAAAGGGVRYLECGSDRDEAEIDIATPFEAFMDAADIAVRCGV